MNTEKLEVAASRVVLGLLRFDELVQVGAQALERGHDSPSLRVLAALNAGEAEEARWIFDRVLSELNIALPSKRDAVMRLARETAKEILAGRSGAYLGAKTIWDYTLRASDEDFAELDSFVYGASEWADRPGDRVALEEGIVAAAKALVARASPSAS